MPAPRLVRGARPGLAAPQGRGPQPHRLLQGPRHGGGGGARARGGQPDADLRQHRQHLGVGGRVRRALRAAHRGGDPGGRASPPASWCRRRCTAPTSWPSPATSTARWRRCASWPPTRASPWSTPSTRTASRARRRRRSRSSTSSATPPTCSPSRSATPATSPPTGAASASTSPTGMCSRLPRMLGGQAAGAAPLVSGAAGRRAADRRHAPSASATRRRGRAPSTRATSPRVPSSPSTTTTSSPRSATSPRVEGVFCEPASAASLAVLRAAVRDGTVARGSSVVCVLTGNGLKDAATAAQGLRAPTPVDGDAGLAGRGARSLMRATVRVPATRRQPRPGLRHPGPRAAAAERGGRDQPPSDGTVVHRDRGRRATTRSCATRPTTWWRAPTWRPASASTFPERERGVHPRAASTPSRSRAGMGSSAAATLSGVLVAVALHRAPWDERRDPRLRGRVRGPRRQPRRRAAWAAWSSAPPAPPCSASTHPTRCTR